MNFIANQLTKFHYLLIAFLIISLLSACKHSDDVSTENGEVTISLTDAEGDFTNYTVDVVSLSLTKANGTTVEMIPEEFRIDFSQYVEMTELLTTASAPTGIYTSASMILDYTNAEIYVETSNGDSQQAASIKDEDGNEISNIEVSVNLEDKDQLIIRRGVPALLGLDFDLKTTNAVEFDDDNNAHIIVSPTLTASLEVDENKVHRVRGPLHSVNLEENNFKLHIKPFFKKMRSIEKHFGKVTVNASDETVFDINGDAYTGTAGLEQLNLLDKLTGVIAKGTINFSTREFIASEVYAGTSVPGGDMDGLTGSVISRNGNQVLVKGATLQRSSGDVSFKNEVNVILDDTTVVRKQGDSANYTIDEISIGQSVTVLGTLDSSTTNPEIDATQGYVRLNVSEFSGTVVTESQTTDYSLALDILRVNKQNVDLFDFTGTGSSPEFDADPEFYEIDTGSLNTSSLQMNQALKIRGFVTPFGQAPADFVAKSVINPGTLKARMHTNWSPSSNTAFSEVTNSKITLDFSNVGKFHHIGRRHQRYDLTELNTSFSLIPNSSTNGIFVIAMPNSKTAYTSFAKFTDDLNQHIVEEKKVSRIKANGLFDSTQGEMTSSHIIVILK